MTVNGNLHKAKAHKYDEFYTQLSDIENELDHYWDHFRDKVVYLNCDDPTVSNFFHYFSRNFRELGLKKLITTCYKSRNRDMFSKHDQERAIYLEHSGTRNETGIPDYDETITYPLKGDGDFRSDECVELLKQVDIVVTNPPFSLFREYVAQLIEHDKKFIIIGPWNAVKYKEIFPLFMDGRIWLGYGFNSGNAYFTVSPELGESFARGVYDASTGLVKFRNVTWFTNLDHSKRHEEMILVERYSPEKYPRYDNYNAIEVSRTKDIPRDWGGGDGSSDHVSRQAQPRPVRDSRLGQTAYDRTDREGQLLLSARQRAVLSHCHSEQEVAVVKVEHREVTVRDLVKGYRDDGEGGVVGYDGKLDIRPPYQREFVYGPEERNAVISTIVNGFPLNVMYWADRGDGTYEVIDGQQRTISIAQYARRRRGFSFNGFYFQNLQPDQQEHILNYKLMVYVCSGTDSEKLDWFRIVNIAGVKLTDQELRNAVYSGSWVSDAKRYFSRNDCAAHRIGGDYLRGSAIRQEYLETAISWISQGNITDYMAQHQHDSDALELWDHFESVIDWVKCVFTEYRNPMKGVDWGDLYDDHKNESLDPKAIENETQRLIDDEDVTSHRGIYPYILTGEEKHLNIRQFSQQVKRRVYERQNRQCAICGDAFDINAMQADHIKPWVDGGKTEERNCQMLCRQCNLKKGSL